MLISLREGHAQLCLWRGGVGAERRRVGVLEDFPKEESPGQMGEDHST